MRITHTRDKLFSEIQRLGTKSWELGGQQDRLAAHDTRRVFLQPELEALLQQGGQARRQNGVNKGWTDVQGVSTISDGRLMAIAPAAGL